MLFAYGSAFAHVNMIWVQHRNSQVEETIAESMKGTRLCKYCGEATREWLVQFAEMNKHRKCARTE